MSLDAAVIAELTGRAQQGSEDAFNELYRLTRDRAYFVAFSIAKNEEDALDILQETYLKAWQSLHTIENPALFDPWLRRITGNAAKNFVKKRKPKLFDLRDNEDDFLEDLPDGGEYEPSAAMDSEETRRLILKLVDDLPEDQRLCVLMRYYDDMDAKEIAAALNIPYETVKSRLRYGKKKISDGVEALEKSGTKLFGAAPVPLLIWALKHVSLEGAMILPPVILGGAAAGTAAVGGGILATIALPKIIAGIAAVVVAGGGTAAGVAVARRGQPLPVNAETTAAVMVPGEDSAAELLWASGLTLAKLPGFPENIPVAGAAGAYAASFVPQTNPFAVSGISQPTTAGIAPNARVAAAAAPGVTTMPPPAGSYTVTYNYAQNGGSSATKASASVAKGGAADLTPKASKPGWEFLGWNTDKNATAGLKSLTINGNVTLYAIFKKETGTEPPAPPVSYTVTYNYTQNGGSSATKASASVAKGGAADLTPKASKPGWEFLGWNTDKSAKAGLKSLAVNGNVTLYAIFKETGTEPPAPPVFYTVSYDYAQNGGSSATKASASVQKGGAADITPTASKSGWEFVGWNTDKNAKADLKTLTVNGNVTLYAIFKKVIGNVRFVDLAKTITLQNVIYNNETPSVVAPAAEDFLNTIFRGWVSYNDTQNPAITYHRFDAALALSNAIAPGTAIGNPETDYFSLREEEVPVSFAHVNIESPTPRPPATYITAKFLLTSIPSYSNYRYSLHAMTPPSFPPVPGYTFQYWQTAFVNYLPGQIIPPYTILSMGGGYIPGYWLAD